MAYDGERPSGFTTWALTLPAAAGLALHMKEIAVLPSTRDNGVGLALLAGVLERAEAEGCARMDWKDEAALAAIALVACVER